MTLEVLDSLIAGWKAEIDQIAKFIDPSGPQPVMAGAYKLIALMEAERDKEKITQGNFEKHLGETGVVKTMKKTQITSPKVTGTKKPHKGKGTGFVPSAHGH